MCARVLVRAAATFIFCLGNSSIRWYTFWFVRFKIKKYSKTASENPHQMEEHNFQGKCTQVGGMPLIIISQMSKLQPLCHTAFFL